MTNSIIPYCYDIGHILGLPTDLSHRFRYRARWIEDTENISNFKGEEGLIVLRNFATGDLIPVRFISVEDVIKAGDVYYIEFQLRGYFSIDQKNEIADRIIKILKEKGIENKGNEQLECLVIKIENLKLGDTVKQIDEDNIERWSDLLKEIGSLNCFRDFSFLKILRLRDYSEAQINVGKNSAERNSFILKPGQAYYLDVIQHIPWEIDKNESIEHPYNVILKTETDEVTILRKVQRVVGKYDLLRFIFKTPSGYMEKHTYLELESDLDIEVSKYGLPALFIPICIQPTTMMNVIRKLQVSISVISIIVVFLSGKLSCYFQVEPDWIRTVALLILVLASKQWTELVKEFVKDTKDIKIT